jgi:hypothetical protein
MRLLQLFMASETHIEVAGEILVSDVVEDQSGESAEVAS